MRKQRFSRLILWALAFALSVGIAPGIMPQPAAAEPITLPTYADPAFQTVWERYDRPVYFGQTSRSYTWGGQVSGGITEAYKEGNGGEHLVQYFDKSRMEINDKDADKNSPFFVTQGLLARDMIRGEVQEGNNTFRTVEPAEIPFGDLDDVAATSPTYASFKGVLSSPPIPAGNLLTQRIERNGSVNNNADPRGVRSVGIVPGAEATNHSIASVFYEFLQRTGPVYVNGQNVESAIFVPTFYVTGLPITEAYWTTLKIAGVYKDVLIQCFERRCLTYNPANSAAFQVELANTGLQYYAWRYPFASDNQPPIFTANPFVTDVTHNSARVVWDTNEPATSEVRYGPTDQYGTLAGNLILVKNHSVVLTGLLPNQNYHYKVTSRDVVGNAANSQDLVFKTDPTLRPRRARRRALPVATAQSEAGAYWWPLPPCRCGR
ncbi:MAG: fibronectin type III domain-containing protein [Thermomicrobiales bacterium]